jgi:hypothetical protein
MSQLIVRRRHSVWLFAIVTGLLFLLPYRAGAQWLKYPTAGVPRAANGAPNLGAAAPRASDGRPDLSGIWFSVNRITDPSCAGGKDCIAQEDLPVAQLNIGQSLPGGLPYKPWAAKLVKQRKARGSAGDPHARCLPPNFPRAYALPEYIKIVQTKGLLLILHEFNASYRQVFTDGRPLPRDPTPAWNGYSVGRWDGDTLVIETTGFRDDLWLDMSGNPLTEAARVTERLRRVNFGTLQIEVTVNDPKAYTKPWTVRLDQEIVLDTELLDHICLENEQDVRHLKHQ